MLQGLRDRSQGWITWVIIVVICITFALWGISNYIGGGSHDPVIAKVNGKTITETDYSNAFQRFMREQAAQKGGELPTNPNALAYYKQHVLQQMISNQVLSDAAYKQGYRVGQDQIDAVIQTLPLFQEGGRFSPQRFGQVLSALMFTPESFMEDFRHIMLISQMHSGFADTAFVLPDEVDTAISLINQKRDFQYLIIPASRFEKTVNISDAAVQTYYQAHQQQFMSPEQVSLQYLELSGDSLMAQIKPSAAELQQYYNDNIAMFTTPEQKEIAHIQVNVPADATPAQLTAAQAKVDKIIQALKQGRDFATVAAQESEDKLTAQKGGLLGWIAPGQLGPQYDQGLASLTTVGQVSAPIRTQYGFDLLKLVTLKPSVAQSFAQAQPQITKTLVRQKADSLFASDSDQLANLAYENPTTLEPAAKALNMTIQTTDLFDRNGAKTGFAADPKIFNAAFSDNVLAQDNNSDPIQLNPSTLVVIRVLKHQAASVLPLAQVQAQIRQKLALQAASKQAQQLGDDLLQQLRAGKNAQQLATQNGLSWQAVSLAARHAPKIDPAITESAFALPAPQTGHPPFSSGVVLEDGGYALVTVSKVVPGTLADSITKVTREQFQLQGAKAIGQLDYDIYTLDALSHAKIKIENKPIVSMNTAE